MLTDMDESEDDAQIAEDENSSRVLIDSHVMSQEQDRKDEVFDLISISKLSFEF